MSRRVGKKPDVPHAQFRPCMIDVEIETRSTGTEKAADGDDNLGPDSKAISTTILLLFSHKIYAEMYNKYAEMCICRAREAGDPSPSAITFTYDGEKDVRIIIDSTLPFYPTKFSERVLTFATAEDAQQWENTTRLWGSYSMRLAPNERRIPDELRYHDFSRRISIPEEYERRILASGTTVYKGSASDDSGE